MIQFIHFHPFDASMGVCTPLLGLWVTFRVTVDELGFYEKASYFRAMTATKNYRCM